MHTGGTLILIRILLIAGFIILYFLAIVLLRPYLPHRKHRFSYLLLKVSYLTYLFFILVFFYFLAFYQNNLDEYFNTARLILIFLSLFLPTIIMLVRKKIRHKRHLYNWVFSVFHFAIVVFYFMMYFQILALYD
ncbi:MAG TPA: hypothetical protein ENK25_10885 [Bacteroidetes bacterium]|nr:hypothetical protein [Bacteroidota bacterium]